MLGKSKSKSFNFFVCFFLTCICLMLFQKAEANSDWFGERYVDDGVPAKIEFRIKKFEDDTVYLEYKITNDSSVGLAPFRFWADCTLYDSSGKKRKLVSQQEIRDRDWLDNCFHKIIAAKSTYTDSVWVSSPKLKDVDTVSVSIDVYEFKMGIPGKSVRDRLREKDEELRRMGF